MRRAILPAAFLACLLASPALPQNSAPSISRMGNGLTLIVQEDHTTPLVAISVWVKAGSANEAPENNGVSHFIEHLVFSATTRRKPGDMDLEMESVGAELNAHTSRDWAHFDTTVPSRYLRKALDVLGDAIGGSQFPEDAVAREKLVILDEIAKSQNNPVSFCLNLLNRELYGSHPYALPVEGSRESIRGISRDQIIDYYRRYYVPENMAVVLVGDLDPLNAATEVGRAFQGVAAKPFVGPETTDPQPPASQVSKFVNAPFKNDYLAVAFLGPKGADTADVCATDVLLGYLGYGYRSWMDQELRNRLGLAVSTHTDYLTQRQPAMISLIAAVTPGNADKAKGALFARIATLRSEGLPAADIELAKRSLLGHYAFQNETFEGRANSLGFYYSASEPMFAVNYARCVQSVSNDDIIRAAQRYLDPSRAVVFLVGPSYGGAR